MNFVRMMFGPALGILLGTSACSSGPGPDDPLTGTWSNMSCYGSAITPPNVESCTVSLGFTAELDISLTATEQNDPAGAVKPRCLTTRQVVGQTWSTVHTGATGSLTVAGTGAETVQTGGCVRSTDDVASGPATDIAIPTGDTEYGLVGSTLTIAAGPLAGTYTQAK